MFKKNWQASRMLNNNYILNIKFNTVYTKVFKVSKFQDEQTITSSSFPKIR